MIEQAENFLMEAVNISDQQRNSFAMQSSFNNVVHNDRTTHILKLIHSLNFQWIKMSLASLSTSGCKICLLNPSKH